MIDGHHHLWNLELEPQAWLTERFAPIARTFEPDELEPLLERCGVECTILVQGACSDRDTDALLEHAAARAWIGAVVAWLPLASPDATRTRLGEIGDAQKLRGVRHLIHNESDPHWILQDAVLESLALLEERGLILELPVVYPRHLDDAALLARTFPRLTIVVDHLGKPPIGTDEMPRWAAQLRGAAGEPNMAAKLSGLNTCIASAAWSADDLREPTAIAVDCFGPDRLLFGSDWPVCLMNGSYEKVVSETRRVLDAVAPDHADAILEGTARRLYRLQGDARASTRSTGND